MKEFVLVREIMEKEIDRFLGRTYLGPLCLRGHDNGNKLSVRYSVDRTCVVCRQENNAKYRERNYSPATEYRQQIELNRKIAIEKGEANYLGGICKRLHDAGGGFSKRYTADKDCTICQRNRKRSNGFRDSKEFPQKPDSKPKKKKQSFLPVVPIHVAPTNKLPTIDTNYKKAIEDARKIEAQLRRQEKNG
jgi:hypothetical protein